MGCSWSNPIREDGNKIHYKISIKTSDAYCRAGTNSKVYLELIGEDGTSTEELEMGNFLKDDFERGQTNHFKMLAKNVGLPILICIKFRNRFHEDKWLCDRITVEIPGAPKKARFPVYDWVAEETKVLRGEAKLPQKETNEFLKLAREQEVAKNKNLFQWIPAPTKGNLGWELPRYMNAATYDDLPDFFKRNETRGKHLKGSKLADKIKLVLKIVQGKACATMTTYEDYKTLYCHKDLPHDNPHYLDNWDTDENFGRQILTGISPLVMSRCSSLPNYFNVTNEDVSKLLDGGKSLEEEMAAGKIYISDYSTITTDVERNKGGGKDEELHCANCIGLFYSNSKGTFLPIAIQLVPNDRDYLFTPDDSEGDWMLAKFFYKCSFSSAHQWIYHFLLTHSIIEPFSVAFFRCFTKSHPIYKMMRQHLQTVVAINTDARNSLIRPQDPANKGLSLSATDTSRKAFVKMTFEDLVIPKRLKKQGIDDKNLLPSFYYRDDIITVWNTMEEYVTNVLRDFYSSDKDVCDDFELQDFAQDVAKNGLGWFDGNTRGMPEKITTINQLIEICVTVMFTSSAQHAAVNFGQFETYKFAPNAPGCMRLPPHKKGQGSQKRIFDSLPGGMQPLYIIAITNALSQTPPNEVYLGEFEYPLFIEEEILEIQQKFQNQLKANEEEMTERNEKLHEKDQYTFLLPSRIPNSIAI